MHVHNLPQLSLSYARHTNSLNTTFQLLSSDYTKSLHLQADRSLEFHTPSGMHYNTRIPRYGRDLQYSRRDAEALVPSVGVNEDGNGEVFRLNLEVGRFMRGYEVDVGGNDTSIPSNKGRGPLQGGMAAGAVNVAAIAEESHDLHAFGTSMGSIEFFDPRARARIAVLPPPPTNAASDPFIPAYPEITALTFNPSGLILGTGRSDGIIYLYDLRHPSPFLKKDQGYSYPIRKLQFLTPSTSSSRTQHLDSAPKMLSVDKRIVKLWDQATGAPWTSVEPDVDLNDVAWCRDSGLLLTANEGRQQHSFFVPQLGPAPRWCSFLDNLVEEMAEDGDMDAGGFGGRHRGGEVYDNYKFVPREELNKLNLGHLVGKTRLVRPYMHGFFVGQELYNEARLIAKPEIWAEQREKHIREKIEKERESRIRGSKKAAVKVNRKLAERMLEREEKNKRRKARRLLQKRGLLEGDAPPIENQGEDEGEEEKKRTLLTDPRFSALFQNEAYAVDEDSFEFRALNASTKTSQVRNDREFRNGKGLTAVEQEDLDSARGSSDSDSEDDGDDDVEDIDDRPQSKPSPETKISSSSYKRQPKSRPQHQRPSRAQPRMQVSSSVTLNHNPQQNARKKSFGARAANLGLEQNRNGALASRTKGNVVGDREITFAVGGNMSKKGPGQNHDRDTTGKIEGRAALGKKERRSASGNTFRRL